MNWEQIDCSSHHEQKFRCLLGDRFLNAREFYYALIQDRDFRQHFSLMLASVPYSAFRWETPALTSVSQEDAFECVLIQSPSLERTPDRTAFGSYFDRLSDDIAVFDNLSGDATLVVPRPIGPDSAYGHLAAFVRSAPADQQQHLWRRLGEVVLDRLTAAPLWVNTAGAGVPWLHLRIDSRPKYYHHRAYKDRRP